MEKEIYIRLRSGEKESELSLKQVSEEYQLALMYGVFKFFDLNVDFKEIREVYHRSGKAYKDFFDKVDNIEKSSQVDSSTKVDSKEYAEALRKQNKTTPPEQSSTEHYVTGVKYDNLNRPLYRCRYKCSDCSTERNHYIKPGTRTIRCYGCQKVLVVKPATSFGEPEKGKDPNSYRDSNGNFYIAGEFQADTKTLADKKG
jgi:DNA-directed RNA polymerase subunit RPC12/RpoP